MALLIFVEYFSFYPRAMGECRVQSQESYRDKSLLLTIQEQCLRNQRKAQAGKESITLEQTTFRLNLSLLTLNIYKHPSLPQSSLPYLESIAP